MRTTASASSAKEATIKYVCGVDIGSQSCVGCICRPDKSVVVKPITFANAREGWQIWEEKLNRLDAPPNQVLIGMEALPFEPNTGNLYLMPKTIKNFFEFVSLCR